jgi:S-DNA-T family DNA segregation ATPase FtsK/SpoIIIE
VRLRPDRGIKIASLERLGEDLKIRLSTPRPPLISAQPGFISVELPRPDRQTVALETYIARQRLAPDVRITLPLGVNMAGKLVECALDNPNTCHFLVGGTTGSGKSVFLRAMIEGLMRRHGPEQVRIALVDPKRVTFNDLQQTSHLWGPVIKDVEPALTLMEELVEEMEVRYQMFEESRTQDLSSYVAKTGKPLPRIVCLFDEYADFMTDPKLKAPLEQAIQRLGAKARAAGIHLVIATQRPEAKVVTPLIRSNLPGRIALRTASEADSRIILGANFNQSAYLLGKGDLLFRRDATLDRLQSLFY